MATMRSGGSGVGHRGRRRRRWRCTRCATPTRWRCMERSATWRRTKTRRTGCTGSTCTTLCSLREIRPHREGNNPSGPGVVPRLRLRVGPRRRWRVRGSSRLDSSGPRRRRPVGHLCRELCLRRDRPPWPDRHPSPLSAPPPHLVPAALCRHHDPARRCACLTRRESCRITCNTQHTAVAPSASALVRTPHLPPCRPCVSSLAPPPAPARVVVPPRHRPPVTPNPHPHPSAPPPPRNSSSPSPSRCCTSTCGRRWPSLLLPPPNDRPRHMVTVSSHRQPRQPHLNVPRSARTTPLPPRRGGRRQRRRRPPSPPWRLCRSPRQP
mmetsp:Transcript_3761/g.8144  ORF Transcript_3761/g.8144 Transcript_3761/m.8144 type:complete len:323 (+) Transcript_3761:113-1081(+)